LTKSLTSKLKLKFLILMISNIRYEFGDI
jgi:hypothetical protein